MASFDKFIPLGLGWRRDLPDPRDFTLRHARVTALLSQLAPCKSSFPPQFDLRESGEVSYFSEPEDQGVLNASSAFSCLALVEYFERRTRGRTFEGSHRFIYEMGRRVGGLCGNSAVGVRETLKVIQRFGTPPEELCPYRQEVSCEILHDASLVGFADELPAFTYFRLDEPGKSGETRLAIVKAMLAAGFPVVMGFPVPRSMTRDAVIPFRPRYDSYRGGQTVLVVGYDDQRIARGEGAVLIRSSWGTQWGEVGHGWLPYAYLTHHLAADCWTVLSDDWADPTELAAPMV